MIRAINTGFDKRCKHWNVTGFEGPEPTLMAQVIKAALAVVILPAALPTIAAGGFIYHIGKGMKASAEEVYSAITKSSQTKEERNDNVVEKSTSVDTKLPQDTFQVQKVLEKKLNLNPLTDTKLLNDTKLAAEELRKALKTHMLAADTHRTIDKTAEVDQKDMRVNKNRTTTSREI